MKFRIWTIFGLSAYLILSTNCIPMYLSRVGKNKPYVPPPPLPTIDDVSPPPGPPPDRPPPPPPDMRPPSGPLEMKVHWMPSSYRPPPNALVLPPPLLLNGPPPTPPSHFSSPTLSPDSNKGGVKGKVKSLWNKLVGGKSRPADDQNSKKPGTRERFQGWVQEKKKQIAKIF